MLRTRGFTFVELALILAIVGVVATLALSSYQNYIERVRIARAVFDIAGLSAELKKFGDEYLRFPASLAEIGRDSMRDPWDNPYRYLSHDDANGKAGFRKDKNIVPINTDFDLWSMGPDGASHAPLTAKASRDDIVRANNGAFIGRASDYDP